MLPDTDWNVEGTLTRRITAPLRLLLRPRHLVSLADLYLHGKTHYYDLMAGLVAENALVYCSWEAKQSQLDWIGSISFGVNFPRRKLRNLPRKK